MLAHRLRRWANINPTLGLRFVFDRIYPCPHHADPVFALSSSSRPWMDVFALLEKSNMAVTESDPDPKIRKISITF